MKYIKWFLLAFVVFDCGYTFVQSYQHTSLDGDVPGIVVPSEEYLKVLRDPFGFNVLLKDEIYPATNRYFIHLFMREALKSVPLFFHPYTDPIDSVYITLAFFRTIIQILIILLFAAYISKSSLGEKGGVRFDRFILAAAVVTPFFQITGFAHVMGITYNSITYTFFYGLPLIFLLLYFYPFYTGSVNRIKFTGHAFLALLALVITFGGPLGPPVILIACPAILIAKFYYYKISRILSTSSLLILFVKENNFFITHLSLIILLSFYSLYIGKNNSENFWEAKPLIERYKLLPTGLWNLMTEKLGPPLLLIMVIINSIVVSKSKSKEAKLILTFIKWVAVCCLIYLLLLPFGGYRESRPFIIRHDTFSPVTISLILLYGSTSVNLIRSLTSKYVRITGIVIFFLVAFIFTNADKLKPDGNKCEREMLSLIANSTSDIVAVQHGCTALSWIRYEHYNQSILSSKLLQEWRIINEEKLFYHVDTGIN